jgi:heme O synthase-like polyprenyltransferase
MIAEKDNAVKRISSALLIRISSVVFTVLVLGLSWLGFFQGANRWIYRSIALVIFFILTFISIKFISETRKAYLAYTIAAIVLILFWLLTK